jgi:hypothetical protein
MIAAKPTNRDSNRRPRGGWVNIVRSAQKWRLRRVESELSNVTPKLVTQSDAYDLPHTSSLLALCLLAVFAGRLLQGTRVLWIRSDEVGGYLV